MKTSVLLLVIAAVSATPGPPTEPQAEDSDRQLPFLSEIQKLQEAFQQLQSNIPPQVLQQLQSLSPFLANILSAQIVQPGRSLLPESLQKLPFFSELQNLQSNIPPEVLQQLQQSLTPLLANILQQDLPTGRAQLPDFLQQFPLFSELKNLQQAFQQLQANIPPEVLQQYLPPFLVNLLSSQQATGRADTDKAAVQELTEEQESELSEFIKRCNDFFNKPYSTAPYSGYSGYSGYNSGYSLYPSYSYSSGYSYGTPQYGIPQYNYGVTPQYNYGGIPQYNNGYPSISIQDLNQQRNPSGRAADIERKHGKGGKGKPWWSKNPYSNFNNYYPQQPYYSPYNYFQPAPSPYYNPYSYYPYQYQNPSYGIIGNNGVILPSTETTTTTVIREGDEKE